MANGTGFRSAKVQHLMAIQKLLAFENTDWTMFLDMVNVEFLAAAERTLAQTNPQREWLAGYAFALGQLQETVRYASTVSIQNGRIV